MNWMRMLLFAAAAGAWAHQPTPVEVMLESAPARHGNSYLRLRNQTRETQTLRLAAGAGGTVEFRAGDRIVVSPGMDLEVNLGDLRLAEGIGILHVVTTVEVDGGGTANGPELFEILRVTGERVEKISYEEAFLSRRVATREGRSEPMRMDLGAGYIDEQPVARRAFAAERLGEGETYERVDEVSVAEMAGLPLRFLPEDGAAEGPQGGTRMARGAERAGGIFGTISGKFLVKMPGPVNQAAWGWKVRAWQLIGSTWLQVAAASVAGDGTWKADFSMPPFPGVPVRVEYQPANRFFQVQDADGDVYTWYDEWDVNGPDLAIGTRVADLTTTGSAPGIDRIYQGGTTLWRKFKKYGMSALRDKPIEITYPNKFSTGKCQTPQGDKKIAWSCSQSGDGKIWMIAPHANSLVTRHELAHSIHSYYWDGDMPSGSGIPHNATKCYNPGLALTEGFATFVAYWAQFDRTDGTPTDTLYMTNVETLGNGFCMGASNESQVAATFWDVYDTVDDGTTISGDGWYFSKPWAPVSTFLKNPGHDSMLEYTTVYKNILGANWATPVTKLFLWNTMYLP